jgi:hypothetical protein
MAQRPARPHPLQIQVALHDLSFIGRTIAMDDKTLQAVQRFLKSFETVFGSDWPYTKEMLGIRDGTPEQTACRTAMGLESIELISPGATFLEPQVEDEESDWGNRAILLESYRKLKQLLSRRA